MPKASMLVRGKPGLGYVIPALAVSDELKSKGLSLRTMTYGNGLLFKDSFERMEVLEEPKQTWLDPVNMFMDKRLKEGTEPIISFGEYYSPYFCRLLGKKNILIVPTTYIERDIEPYRTCDILARDLYDSNRLISYGIVKPSRNLPNHEFVGPIARKPIRNIDEVRRMHGLKDFESLFIFNLGWSKDVEKLKGVIEKHRREIEWNFNSRIVAFRINSDIKKLRPGSFRFAYDFSDQVAAADLMITTTGISSLCEISTNGKRAVMIKEGDIERDFNADQAERLGYGKTVKLEDVTKSVKRLLEAIEVALKAKPERITNGTEKAAEIIMKEVG